MPNMNGFEFLTSRRQEPNLAQIPVAMLTSRNSEKHRSLAKQLGAVAYFTKPYIEEEFFQEISKLI
jgi:chemotaxis family two-component system sensor histidine kinase/response regulator PixL